MKSETLMEESGTFYRNLDRSSIAREVQIVRQK
jgi:hypothetical protein